MTWLEFDNKEFGIVADNRLLYKMTGEELCDNACIYNAVGTSLLNREDFENLFAYICVQKAVKCFVYLEYGREVNWLTQDMRCIGMMYTTCDGEIEDDAEHDLQWILDLSSESPLLLLYIDNEYEPSYRFVFDDMKQLAQHIGLYCDFDLLYGKACEVFRDLEEAGAIEPRA